MSDPEPIPQCTDPRPAILWPPLTYFFAVIGLVMSATILANVVRSQSRVDRRYPLGVPRQADGLVAISWIPRDDMFACDPERGDFDGDGFHDELTEQGDAVYVTNGRTNETLMIHHVPRPFEGCRYVNDVDENGTTEVLIWSRRHHVIVGKRHRTELADE